MKTNHLKIRKTLCSYFLRSLFTLTLLTSVACSNESPNTELINESNTELEQTEAVLEDFVDLEAMIENNADFSAKADGPYYRFTNGLNGGSLQMTVSKHQTVIMDLWKGSGPLQNFKKWYVEVPKGGAGKGMYIRNKTDNRYLTLNGGLLNGDKIKAVKKLPSKFDKKFLWKFQGADCVGKMDVKKGKCYRIFSTHSTKKYLIPNNKRTNSPVKIAKYFKSGHKNFVWHGIEL